LSLLLLTSSLACASSLSNEPGNASDGGETDEACTTIAQTPTDADALAQVVACLHSPSDDAAKSTAIDTFVATVDDRGGFPIQDGDSVHFVYVPKYDPAASRHTGSLALLGSFIDGGTSAPLTEEGGLAELSLPVAAASRPGAHYRLVAGDGSAFADPLARRFQFDGQGEFSLLGGSDDASHLERILSVHASQLDVDRPIYLYVPAGYESATARYPVLYMQDGQNLFDARMPRSSPVSWEADQVADAEISAGNARPFLMVAIPNDANRFGEYTMTTDDIGSGPMGGQGPAYADFVVHDLMPLINGRYRTLTDPASTGIFGSSLGGLIAYELGLLHPDVFGKVGGMSGTFDWGVLGQSNPTVLDRYRASTSLSSSGQIFYLDSGGGPPASGTCPGSDSDNYCVTLEMKSILESKGFDLYPDDPSAPHITPADANIEHWYVQGAPHQEGSWHARLYRVFRFFFRT
jgi:predicted alpha/beta superfamily hydrolase